MGSQRHELTIDEALADPMIGALMRADHVEPKAFRTFLQDSAATLTSQRGGSASALSWCCAIASRVSGREAHAR